MKYAMTMDGKIAAYTGNSQWITGEAARQNVHRDRNRYTAIMAGIGTVLADDPLLTCRIPEGKNLDAHHRGYPFTDSPRCADRKDRERSSDNPRCRHARYFSAGLASRDRFQSSRASGSGLSASFRTDGRGRSSSPAVADGKAGKYGHRQYPPRGRQPSQLVCASPRDRCICFKPTSRPSFWAATLHVARSAASVIRIRKTVSA